MLLYQRTLARMGFTGPARVAAKAPLTRCEVSRPQRRRGAEAPAAASAVCIETRNTEESVSRGRSIGLGTSTGSQQRMVTSSQPLLQQPAPTGQLAFTNGPQVDSTEVASTSERRQPPGPGALRAEDAWEAFERQLEADLATVGVTLVAILGVICFWRGVWSLLDHYLGDSPLADLSCILLGLGIIAYIRLAGLKVGSFWPSG